jgi:hypothetical protein
MDKSKRASQKFWKDQIERYEVLIRDNPKALNFIAMVRLSEIATHARELGIPEHGALLFFYDVARCQGSFWPEARGGWQVIYAPDESDPSLTLTGPTTVSS